MFLEILIVATIVLSLVYLGLTIYQKKAFNMSKDEILTTLKTYGVLSVVDHMTTLKLNDQIYEILFLHVPAGAELTINSRNKWDIHVVGKSHIIDQTKRLASPYPKIVIIFPSILRIKRYINENEMVFVQETDKVYDFYLVRKMDIDNLLKRLTSNA